MKDPVTKLAQKIFLQHCAMVSGPYSEAMVEQMSSSAWLAARTFYDARESELDKRRKKPEAF